MQHEKHISDLPGPSRFAQFAILAVIIVTVAAGALLSVSATGLWSPPAHSAKTQQAALAP